MTTTERVNVRCPECNEVRSLTVRQARRAGQCPYCRYPIKIVINTRYKRYWTERFSMSEIRVLANSIFEDIPERRPALMASTTNERSITANVSSGRYQANAETDRRTTSSMDG